MDHDNLLPDVQALELKLPVEVSSPAAFERTLAISAREARLLADQPWVRPLSRLNMDVTTQGWRFPSPPGEPSFGSQSVQLSAEPAPVPRSTSNQKPTTKNSITRIKPAQDTIVFKERLLYLLQPPLESCLAGRQIR